MAYVTQQAVLKAAGMWFRITGEEPAGLANGSNTVFTVAHKPLADNNQDDSVTIADVVLYVNGTPVTVASVNETTGAITASAAPANGAVVTADYSYSAVASSAVAAVIQEAEDWIDEELETVTTTPFTDTPPATVRKCARFYAAGLLQAEEVGIASVNDQTANEAAAKIKQAEKWLAEYSKRLQANQSDDGVLVVTDKKSLFETYNETEARWDPLADEQFGVNRAS